MKEDAREKWIPLILNTPMAVFLARWEPLEPAVTAELHESCDEVLKKTFPIAPSHV